MENKNDNSGTVTKITSGAGAGAALGFMFGGPLGAAIGGTIGVIGTYILTERSKDKK